MRQLSMLSIILLVAIILGGCLNALPPTGDPSSPPTGGAKASLTGTVQDARSGLKLWDGQATLTRSGGPSHSTSIKGGVFEFQNLAPGTYTLTINALHYKQLQKQVVVTGANITISEKLTPIFSAAELDLLARLVHAEAKGESYEGQVAVAATVLNRLVHPDYPNSLEGVIYQVIVSGGRRYYQYEPVLNGAIKSPASQTAKDAVADALAGWDPSRGATGFFAPAKVGSGSWVWTRTPTVTIGNHRFFK
ncbi:cell wall hydrolase [Candidatus Darwinibacter acetoxidans]